MNQPNTAEQQQADAQQDRPQGQQQPAGTTPAAAATKPKAPATLFVIDTTAKPGNKPRDHQQIVDGVIKTYSFWAGKPLELPLAVAIKFLKHEEFKLTNAQGDLLPYHRRPKQPDELEAGEHFKIADDETIAKYGELTNRALFQRALELPAARPSATPRIARP